jgi:type IX secretion system PorP/SprF family membrane protein
MLGEAHLLSIGFNAGVSNKRINTSELKFPDQFDGQFFDNTLPTSVFIDNPNITYFDFQTGINYAYFPTEYLYVNGGVSVHHLNRPRESFFSQDSAGVSESDRIPMRYTAFANTSYKLSEELIVNGMAYYSKQSTSSEIVAGGNLQYNLSGDGESQLLGGLYLRAGDAVVPVIGYQWKNIRLMFSYDATTSQLKQYNNGRGAFEFALIHNGFYSEYNGDRRQSFCPTF